MSFLAKNQKILIFGKIRKYDKEGVFFRAQKRFHLFKSLFYQNGKAEKVPMVAGRLVTRVELSLIFSHFQR